MRPRNQLERDARAEFTGRRKQGRSPDITSRSQGAKTVAFDLVEVEGLSKRAAAAKAANLFGLKSADNIRRQLRRDKSRAMVKLKCVGLNKNFWGGLVTVKEVPAFLGVIDLETGEITQGTNDPEGLTWLKEQVSRLKITPKNQKN
jgi:hypothetical protein